MCDRFITDYDLHLLAEGTHYRSFEKLGAHVCDAGGSRGTHFAVWAPNAERVALIGEFNDWNPERLPMRYREEAGVWETFVDGVATGTLYKYAIHSKYDNYYVEKADPYGFAAEIRPLTASKIFDISGYRWNDEKWMSTRAARHSLHAPFSVYEVHLGSWMRNPYEGNRWLSYRELAPLLSDYITRLGYTHVEFLPVTEHPFDGSWGYQTIGYYAPTARFGSPHDFMYLIDVLHQNGIGVLLDWVPAHFPRDGHGLSYFDGTYLYEHMDPRLREHQHWGTLIFNYGRREVANFLISNALYWIENYHIDGLRVDAVASMLYLDYGRNEGEWMPNVHGGRENLEAIEFLRRFNQVVYKEHPDVVTIAEESTSWPMVSRPTYLGGLGFGLKWNLGWMHDMLHYMSRDPIYRSFHHNNLTFGIWYAFTENFLLPFSHDEVVHLKKSMISKMPGDDWQKFANLRLLYGFMYGHPGKKLLFMGSEFGQWGEWNHDASLDWGLLEYPLHRGLQQWVEGLNRAYRAESPFHEIDFEPHGFEWIDCNDTQASVVSFLRRARTTDEILVFVGNFTPAPRYNYRIGVPFGGYWREILNSDATVYGGSGIGNYGGVEAKEVSTHGRSHSIEISLPPLSIVVFKGRPPIVDAVESESEEAVI